MRLSFLSILILLLDSMSTNATHLVGATMRYSNTGGTRYEFEMVLARDCLNGEPGTEFEPLATIGLFRPNNSLHFNLFQAELISKEITTYSPDTFCLGQVNVCYEEARYEFAIDIGLDLSGWSVVHQRCCRSHILNNVLDPLNTGLTLQTIIRSSEENQGAEINHILFKVAVVNAPLIYDVSTTDADGDSLVYSLLTPLIGASDAMPLPQIPSFPPYDTLNWYAPYSRFNMIGGSEPLRIHPQTGVMTAIPDIIGLFQIAYGISEYRNGELIAQRSVELLMLVIPGAGVERPIQGTVYTRTSEPLDHGNATLIEHTFSDDSLRIFDQQVLMNGQYDFGIMPQRAFYVKAEPDQVSVDYDLFVPTYWPRSLFWYNASEATQCDAPFPLNEIDLLPIATSVSGNIHVTGTIDQIRTKAPPKNVTIFFLQGDSITGYSHVDDNGNFEVLNLSPGLYDIYVDALNTEVYNQSPPQLTIHGNTQIECRLHHAYLEILQITSTIDPVRNSQPDFVAYFNSNAETLVINTNAPFNADCNVLLYDLKGINVDRFSFPQGESIIQRQIPRLEPGMYIISIVDKSERQIRMHAKAIKSY